VAVAKPKLSIAVALLALAAPVSTVTYAGFLVIDVLAEHLGTSRVAAGVLLGVLFARFTWVRQGKLRVMVYCPNMYVGHSS
jgi:hypothetical protein